MTELITAGPAVGGGGGGRGTVRNVSGAGSAAVGVAGDSVAGGPGSGAHWTSTAVTATSAASLAITIGPNVPKHPDPISTANQFC